MRFEGNFIDVFAGCGGLSLGLMQAGWKGLFAIEHDTNAYETLRHNLAEGDRDHHFDWPDWLPKTPLEITDVLQKYRTELAGLRQHVDMLVGGPPCQGFSSAGRRDLNDPRNRLVEAYLDFVDAVQPKLVLLENVRGITSDFKDIDSSAGIINYSAWLIEGLSDRYHVSTRILDTSDFGVPQKRRRYFLIGVRKNTDLIDADPFELIEKARQSFLLEKGITTLPVSAKSAISDLELDRNERIPSRESKGFEEISYDNPLTSYQRIMNKGHQGTLTDTRLARHKPEIAERFGKIIKTCHKDGRLNTSLSAEVKASFGLKKNAIRVLDPDAPAPTITSMPDDLLHYSEPRTLTVRENARIQSFPDWFEFKGKYTTGGDRRRREVPRFTQVANAVPPLVAEAIGKALSNYLAESKQSYHVNGAEIPRVAPQKPLGIEEVEA